MPISISHNTCSTIIQKRRTIRSRQRSIKTQNEETNENRSLPKAQEGGAVGLIGEEAKLKPQLRQMQPREERNDETMKRTADKAIQMSLKNGLDHAGETGDQISDGERQEGLTKDNLNGSTGRYRLHQTASTYLYERCR